MYVRMYLYDQFGMSGKMDGVKAAKFKGWQWSHEDQGSQPAKSTLSFIHVFSSLPF